MYEVWGSTTILGPVLACCSELRLNSDRRRRGISLRSLFVAVDTSFVRRYSSAVNKKRKIGVISRK